MFGIYVVDQNGRVLTAKYIEVEPYPWLEKLEKSAKKMITEICKGFNRDLQGKNDEKVVYILIGGDYRAWTYDLTNVNRTL